MKIKKNGKIITLTESDLKRIAGVVLREDAKGDPGTDFVKCCNEAGISKVPPSCVAGNTLKCMEELGTMISSDPLGMGMKALVALNCLKDKLKSPVMNESDDEIEGDTSLDVELEGVDENDPDPTKIQRILNKVENFLKKGELPKNLQRFKRKINNLFKKHGKPTHKILSTQCPKW